VWLQDKLVHPEDLVLVHPSIRQRGVESGISQTNEIIEDGQMSISSRRHRLRRTMGFLSDQGEPFYSKMP